MSEEESGGDRWKCKVCGMTENVLPYCSNCGKARGAIPGGCVGPGCLAVIALVFAGVFGSCSISGLQDPSQVRYWGRETFDFFLLSAAGALVFAVWMLWVAWKNR